MRLSYGSGMGARVEGSLAPEPWSQWLVKGVFALFMMPWIIMAAMMDFGAYLSLVVGGRDPEQGWVMLRAGGALTLLISGIFYYLFIRVPALTVRDFRLDGTQLWLRVPKRGELDVDVDSIDRVDCERSRRGIVGWWVKIREVGWVFLDTRTTNLDALIRAIDR